MQVQAVTKKMEENKKEFEMKLDEYARLLDLRAARIKVPLPYPALLLPLLPRHAPVPTALPLALPLQCCSCTHIHQYIFVFGIASDVHV